MLKLVYHTAVFGPIDLEYDRPLIRVGSSEDNELVLRHSSIDPHHCLLLFRGEKVLCLPPSHNPPPPSELSHLTGNELGFGDVLKIGELEFSLAHSPNTVSLPEVPGSMNDVVEDPEIGSQPHYYCAHCRISIRHPDVKHVGLVGHGKRNLCPKCSGVLETPFESEKPPPEPKKLIEQKSLRRVIGSYQARLLGRKDS